jgi:hypothetical protein
MSIETKAACVLLIAALATPCVFAESGRDKASPAAAADRGATPSDKADKPVGRVRGPAPPTAPEPGATPSTTRSQVPAKAAAPAGAAPQGGVLTVDVPRERVR